MERSGSVTASELQGDLGGELNRMGEHGKIGCHGRDLRGHIVISIRLEKFSQMIKQIGIGSHAAYAAWLYV